MSILSDKDMRRLIEEKNVVYVKGDPDFDPELQIGPSSVDLRLGYQFSKMESRKVDAIDTKELKDLSNRQRQMEATPEDGIVVHPGEFLLGTTLETVKLPEDITARIEGRSSYARLGLLPHAAGGFIDAGFEGQITLEFKNLGKVPITIYPEDRICQMSMESMSSKVETGYGEKKDSKYMNQSGATEARLDREKR